MEAHPWPNNLRCMKHGSVSGCNNGTKYSTILFMISVPEPNLPSFELPGRRLILFPVGNLYFFYLLLLPSFVMLLIVPPTDKTSIVHQLQPLNGNALKTHFFSFFILANVQKICFTLRWKPGWWLEWTAKDVNMKQWDHHFHRSSLLIVRFSTWTNHRYD